MNNIFKEEPKAPFSVSLNIKNTEKTTKSLFHSIKNIFIQGLIMIQDSNSKSKKLEILTVKVSHIEKMKKYMLSMGIELVFKTYYSEDKDHLYRKLLYDIEKIPELSIKITSDWKNDFIEKIHVTVPKNEINLKQYNEIVYEHFEANHFLQFRDPYELRDYAIFIKKNQITSVIYFNFAPHPVSYKCYHIKA